MSYVSKKTISLIGYTLVIGGSFYLGLLLFPLSYKVNNSVAVTSLKRFDSNLEKSAQKDLILEMGNTKLTVKSSDIKKWVETYTRNYTGNKDARISSSLLSTYLESVAPRFNIEPIDAKLKFSGGKADIFVPSQDGKKLDIQKSLSMISVALSENQSSVSLPFEVIEPEITLEKINDLGINTLLATGTSDYGKSPRSRINNIKVGLAKFNGIILKPGEEFSFNKILGDVEAKDGYEAELVIKGGQLVKEYGGGLCQVSTTIFRAAIMAGFPIVERKPHYFPVQYYNPQGFDSTIYPGVVDLKFTNNTSQYVLIQTKLTGSKITVEVYGSDEGRKVTLQGPFQYDQKANGALKAYFTREIYQGDQLVKTERFDSVYNPPPASHLEKNPLE